MGKIRKKTAASMLLELKKNIIKPTETLRTKRVINSVPYYMYEIVTEQVNKYQEIISTVYMVLLTNKEYMSAIYLVQEILKNNNDILGQANMWCRLGELYCLVGKEEIAIPYLQASSRVFKQFKQEDDYNHSIVWVKVAREKYKKIEIST